MNITEILNSIDYTDPTTVVAYGIGGLIVGGATIIAAVKVVWMLMKALSKVILFGAIASLGIAGLLNLPEVNFNEVDVENAPKAIVVEDDERL